MVAGSGSGWEGKRFQEQGGDTRGLSSSPPPLLSSPPCFISLFQPNTLRSRGSYFSGACSDTAVRGLDSTPTVFLLLPEFGRSALGVVD